MSIMPEMVQPGWTVFDSNGEEVGRVVEVEGHTIRVRPEGGLRHHEVSVPLSACRIVEEGRVELSKRRNELE